jgi:hypothetical protein
LIANEKALQRLRDLAGYEVAKSILLSSKRKGIMINKEALMYILEQVIDCNTNQAYRIIERLVRSGKLIEILPPPDSDSPDSILLQLA